MPNESTPIHIANGYESFFHGWFARQERFLRELQCAERRIQDGSHQNDDVLNDLITRVSAHYQQYYVEKSRVGQRRIFLLFSPPWLSSLERALLWVAGFKPSLAFKLVSQTVHDLSQDQTERMKRLVDETRVEERALNDELARIHESMAAPPLLGVARSQVRAVDGQIVGEAEAVESLREAMEVVVSSADLLRTTLGMKVVGILSPQQSVRFFAAAMQMH